MTSKLRKLNINDSSNMFEWMKNKNITDGLSSKFDNVSIEMCREFINNSLNDKNNLHLAVANDNDEYYGTVSLKNINNGYAEFAIVLREIAMRKGYSSFAIKEIIKKGFTELGLSIIYWSVKKDNFRAIKFYNKNGYKMFNILDNEKLVNHASGGGYKSPDFLNLLWYKVEIFEYNKLEK